MLACPVPMWAVLCRAEHAVPSMLCQATPASSKPAPAQRSAMVPKLKLTYFNMTGRAEGARVLFTLGKVPFEDVKLDFKDWPAIKPTCPFGQVPTLEIGEGNERFLLAQMGAINRYAARLAGLYPDDPLEAAKTEMVDFTLNEILEPMWNTMIMDDVEKAQKARADLLAGMFGDRLTALDRMLASSGADYVLGNKLTWADVSIFVGVSGVNNGMLTGFPADYLSKYPALKKLRELVASLPEVAARYADAGPEDKDRNAFKPEVTAPAVYCSAHPV